MREQGLISNFVDYWQLPEPVVTAYRMDAEERGAKMARELAKANRAA